MTPALDTRDKLMDAARRLYAERGVFNVSLAEVVRAAGQRNTSAIHYHFGSREQLLLAIMDPQVHTLRARRDELLAKARLAQGPAVVVEALVRPLVELAREGWRARAWMKIGLELADHNERIAPELESLLFGAGGGEALSLLAERCEPMPAVVWNLRTNLCIGFAARAATERARIIDDQPPRSAPMLSDEAFVSNLVEMFLGALTAPVPPGT
jgi:AcrR family transcriptional regulator